MRTDTAIYTSSAQKVQNMIVTAEGSAKETSGNKSSLFRLWYYL